MKRIAVFTNQFPAKVSTFFARDIYSLIEAGYKVDIFPIYPIQERNWKYVPENLRGTIRTKSRTIYVPPLYDLRASKPKGYGDEIRAILVDSFRFGMSQVIKSLIVIAQASQWSEHFDGHYDQMISFWGNYAGTYGYLANKSLTHKIPYSFFLHAGTDLYRDQIHLEQKILYASRIFVVCEYNRKFLKNLYPYSFDGFNIKLTVHNPGLDIENIPFHDNHRNGHTLLTIGSLSAAKGFSQAIHAFAKVTASDKDLRLLMIGEGPEKRGLQKLAKSLGVEDQVEFLGWLTFEQVKTYLASSTILIHPSSDLGDAVPTVIKEAMASGLPVIGSDIVGIPELLDYGNCGVLVPPKDVDALAKAIRMLLDDPEKRSELARRARAFAEKNFTTRLADVIS